MPLTVEDCRILAYRMETMDDEMLDESYRAIAEAREFVTESDRDELDGSLQDIARLLLQRRGEGSPVRERRPLTTHDDASDDQDTRSIKAEVKS